MKNWLLSVVLISTLNLVAQRRDNSNNGIGISAGVNQGSISTSDFEVQPELGWNVGLQVRGNFYNDFDMVYAIQFSESNFSVPTLNAFAAPEDVKYKLSGAQISLMLSYKIFDEYLSVEAGPVLQVNGKLALDESQEQNTISGTTLKAIEIADVSPFNFHGAIGLTAGVKHLRLSIQYLYGINNILGNVESPTDLKGHLGIISGNVIVFL